MYDAHTHKMKKKKKNVKVGMFLLSDFEVYGRYLNYLAVALCLMV